MTAVTAVTAVCDWRHSSSSQTDRYLVSNPGPCLALMLDRLKRVMNRPRAQHNQALRLASRAVGLALVLALISLQQAWAAAFCCSDDRSGAPVAMDSCEHQAAPIADPHAGMHQNASAETQHGCTHHNSSPASQPAAESESLSETGGQPGNGQPCSLSCCQVQPQSDVPVASFSVQQPSLETLPSLPQLVARIVEPLLATEIPKPPRSRPVYLTVSAFLI